MGCGNSKNVQIGQENQKDGLKTEENKKSQEKDNSVNFLLTSYNKRSIIKLNLKIKNE